MLNLHPALVLAFEIWGYIFAIAVVLGIAGRLVKAGETIEHAKFLPGGEYHKVYQNDEAEEEFGYRAHA